VTGHDEGRQAFQWLQGAAVRLHGFPESNRPGAIDVLPGGGGGAVSEHLDELPSWLALAARLSGDAIETKVKKLRSTGRPELHLFIRVHDTAMPFSLYYPLAWGDAVPGDRVAVSRPPCALAAVEACRPCGARSSFPRAGAPGPPASTSLRPLRSSALTLGPGSADLGPQ